MKKLFLFVGLCAFCSLLFGCEEKSLGALSLEAFDKREQRLIKQKDSLEQEISGLLEKREAVQDDAVLGSLNDLIGQREGELAGVLVALHKDKMFRLQVHGS